MGLILCFYILLIIGIGVSSIFGAILGDFDDIAVTPKEIYDINDMNMLGCVIAFIVGFILNPLFYIAHFIHWLFHVGRKD